MISKSSNKKSSRHFHMDLNRVYVFFFLSLAFATSHVQSINNIGCLIDQDLCEDNEYCVDDNNLGYCVDLDNTNMLTNKVIRSEIPIETYIDAPIRIHKYNTDSSEEQEDQELHEQLEQLEPLEADESEEEGDLSYDNRDDYLNDDDKRPDDSKLSYDSVKSIILSKIEKRNQERLQDEAYSVLADIYSNNIDNDDTKYDDYEASNVNEQDYYDEMEPRNEYMTKRDLFSPASIDYFNENDYSPLATDDDDYVREQEPIVSERLQTTYNDYQDELGDVLEYLNNDKDYLLSSSSASNDDAIVDNDYNMEFLDKKRSVNNGLFEYKAFNAKQYGFNDDVFNYDDLIDTDQFVLSSDYDKTDNSNETLDLNQLQDQFNREDQRKLNSHDNDDDYFVKALDRVALSQSNQIMNQPGKPDSAKPVAHEISSYDLVDGSYVFVELDKPIVQNDVNALINLIQSVPKSSLNNYKISNKVVYFKLDNARQSDSLLEEINVKKTELEKSTGLKINSCGFGQKEHHVEIVKEKLIDSNSENFFLVAIIICVTVTCVIFTLLIIFIVRRRAHLRNKLASDVTSHVTKSKHFNDEERLISSDDKPTWSERLKSVWPFRSGFRYESNLNTTNENSTPSQNYQDLCRHRMQGKATPMGNTKDSNDNASMMSNESTPSVVPNRANNNNGDQKESGRSSTSSWSEEPITSVNMDITTGHVILAYIEEFLNDKNRLNKEWEELMKYEADSNKTEAASLPQNMTKNRYSNILAYDHNRVKLENNKESDYINASFITDDDPKNPAYIATQGPLIHTTCDFWKMIWDQGSVVIVSLCRTVEYGSLKCNQYWPANGCEVYDKFEVHLVSEHVWCDDYLVRSFYLKNLETNQSRTVTQFHFLTWSENSLPSNIKSILDFRRKVNKSYKSKSSPIVVHCNDGIGRTGTYIMIDMVLNKIIKGAKEIDLAAIVEFLRDQRVGMIKSKSQFEFSFAVITEEVQNMLKAIAQ